MYFRMPVSSAVLNLTHSEFGEPVCLSSSDSLLWKSVMWSFRPSQFAFLYSTILRGFWWGLSGDSRLSTDTMSWSDRPGMMVARFTSVLLLVRKRSRVFLSLAFSLMTFQDLVRRGSRWSHYALRGGGILASVSCLPNQSHGSWRPRWPKHVIWCGFLCGAPMSAADLCCQGHWHRVGRNQPCRGFPPRICPVWPIHVHILFLGHPILCCGYRFVLLETLRLPAC